MLVRSLLSAAILALAGLVGHTAAQPLGDVVRMQIVPGWHSAPGRHMAGLRITLAPGWKTYWRAPGETGIPPAFDFDGSRNLTEARIHWPRPDVFDTYGLETIGYADEVVLPLELTPRRPGEPMALSVHAAIGVCRDVCLPVEVVFEGTIPAGGGSSVPAIRAALARVPETLTGGAAARCALAPIADGLRLTARLPVPDQGGQERVFVEPGRSDVWVSPAEVTRRGGTITAAADLVPPEAAPFALDRGALRFTILGSDGAAEMVGCQAE